MLLMFYTPPANDPVINRAVAWLDGPYSHVEVGFSDGMASSIFAGEKVFMHPRRFANPNYTTVGITASAEQVQRAREFCVQSSAMGIGFDGVGMYAAGLPRACRGVVIAAAGLWERALHGVGSVLSGGFRARRRASADRVDDVERGCEGSSIRGGATSSRGTFCSRYVVEVLQHAGMPGFEGLDPAGMTPSMVFRCLEECTHSVGSGVSSIMAITPYKRELLSRQGSTVTLHAAVCQ